MLAARLLWRNWRSGEVRILSAALVLAVAVVTCIAVFTDRLEQALTAQSHTFLAADRVVRSSSPINPEWRALARDYQLRSADTVTFSSMIYAGEQMHLAAVKAVSPDYPLRGQLLVSQHPFATDESRIATAAGGPPAGEAWVDSRLLPLLQIDVGDPLVVGEKRLRVSRVIVQEPDRSSGFASAYGARLMMNVDDLAATGVVQPGSRISYRWLLAGSEPRIESFVAALQPRLSSHERILDVESSQQGLASTLATGRQFLLLSAMISVLLAGVAIAIAARRFAARHVDQVALLKSLGAGAGRIRSLYAVQLLILGLLASALGLVLGLGLQAAVASSIAAVFQVSLGAIRPLALLPGLLTGMVCLLFFVAPPLWHLPQVPPLKILRRELAVSGVRHYRQALLGLLAVVVLVLVFSRDLWLSASIVAALLMLLLLASLFALLLLWLGNFAGRRAGSIWRLAVASLQRNRQQSVIQMMVFALAVMLVLSLASLRTSLLEDWQLQIGPETPNHFLMNVAPPEVDAIRTLMQERDVEPQLMFPMVRGRLTHINDVTPAESLREQAEVLRREINLSWSRELNDDNRIVRGQWWGEWQDSGLHGVSVEETVADQLGLKLGDDLRFSIGGLTLEARVASIRSLKWDSMNPNFYFLLSPGALDDYAPTYLTSFYLEPEQKVFVNTLLQQFPTVVVIELDRVIEQIRAIVDQVSAGVELMLGLVLLAGLLVMWAAVGASMNARLQEAALLRALGCSRYRLLGSLWIEFALLGLLAGIMAAAGAEILRLSIQYWVLDVALRFYWPIWLWGIAGSSLLVGLLGVLACRRVVNTPPGLMLRELS